MTIETLLAYLRDLGVGLWAERSLASPVYAIY